MLCLQSMQTLPIPVHTPYVLTEGPLCTASLSGLLAHAAHLWEPSKYQNLMLTLQARLLGARVIVATCGAAGILREAFPALVQDGARALGRTHVMIDEAGQASFQGFYNPSPCCPILHHS